MIEKELVTTQTEVWRDPHHTHRYVFKRQWAIKGKEACIDVNKVDTKRADT